MSRGKFHIFMNRLAKNSAVARTSISQLSHLLLTLYSSLEHDSRTGGTGGARVQPPALTSLSLNKAFAVHMYVSIAVITSKLIFNI